MYKLESLAATVLACAALAGAALLPAATVQAVAPTDDAVHVRVAGGPLAALTTQPMALSPAFDPSTRDYVLRCAAGTNRVTLSLTASAGSILATPGASGHTIAIPVTLAESQAAILETRSGAYWVRCLPHDFPVLSIDRPRTPPVGWYVTGNVTGATTGTSGRYAMVLDSAGTPVWFMPVPAGLIDADVLPNQTLAWSPDLGPGVGAIPDGAFTLLHLATQTTQSLRTPTPPLDPHELLQLPNGDVMLIASPLRSGMDLAPLGASMTPASGTIVDCVVQEVSPSGALVWQWRASDHIAISESTSPQLLPIGGHRVADVYHCNSIDEDPSGAGVLISVRQASGVYDVSRASGDIEWKLGGGAPAEAGVLHLTVTGDPEHAFSEQHDARFQPGGRISVYDDHSLLPGPARGVEYTLDPAAGTARMDWEYANPGGVSAFATGSFRRILGGTDNIIGWGFAAGSGFSEVDRSGRLLMSVTFPNGEFDYRVIKVAPSALSPVLLHDAMDHRSPLA